MGIGNARWGHRSQIQGTLWALQDARGNRDQIPRNERKEPGDAAGVHLGPLGERLAASVAAGLSTRDEIRELEAFRKAYEAAHGPVLSIPEGMLRHGALFAVQKAIALERTGRSPRDVTEGFLEVHGKVDGVEIAPREVFFQRYAPSAAPSGKTIVVSPGFQETGRSFLDPIEQLCAQGHEVLVMDHQWAGQTRPVGGKAKGGGLDRGYGVARDVAAMAAYAADLVRARGGVPERDVVLFGNSMGAGPGVLGAMVLNDAGRIELSSMKATTGEGSSAVSSRMPVGLSAVLQAPFLRATPNAVNRALAAASRIPVVNRIAAWSIGVPVLTRDPVGARRGAHGAVVEDVRAQLKAMTAALADVEKVLALVRAGEGPRGRLAVVHGDGDPLADPARVQELAALLGGRMELSLFRSDNHVHQQTPGDQDRALRALARLLEGPPADRARAPVAG